MAQEKHHPPSFGLFVGRNALLLRTPSILFLFVGRNEAFLFTPLSFDLFVGRNALLLRTPLSFDLFVGQNALLLRTPPMILYVGVSLRSAHALLRLSGRLIPTYTCPNLFLFY